MKQNFGERLAELRLDRQMTHAELARAAGLKEATVKRLERRGTRPSRRTAIDLANALNVPPTILMGTAKR